LVTKSQIYYKEGNSESSQIWAVWEF
jgi:hypothetical protein